MILLFVICLGEREMNEQNIIQIDMADRYIMGGAIEGRDSQNG